MLFPNAEYLISRADAVHIRGTVKDLALGRLNAIEEHTIVYEGEYLVNPDIARLGEMYERLSRRRGAGCAVVAVAHEMARIMYFMLVRGEPYRGENRGLTERKLKNMSRRAFDGLRN